MERERMNELVHAYNDDARSTPAVCHIRTGDVGVLVEPDAEKVA